jgi:hypothetical protein
MQNTNPSFLKYLKKLIKREDFKNLNIPQKRYIISLFLLKTQMSETPLENDQNYITILEYLEKKNLINKNNVEMVSQKILSYWDFLYGLKNSSKKIRKSEEKINLGNNLKNIFEVKNTTAFKYANYDGGVVLLNAENNNIIYCNQQALKLLEIKKYENINFFHLLIPFSLKWLEKKFNKGEIFGDHKEIGSTANFKIIIYSKKAKNRYLSYLQKKTIVDKNQINEKDIFFKYLNSLDVSAKIITFDPENKSDEEEYPKKKIIYILKIKQSKKIQSFNFSLMKNDEKIKKWEKKLIEDAQIK